MRENGLTTFNMVRVSTKNLEVMSTKETLVKVLWKVKALKYTKVKSTQETLSKTKSMVSELCRMLEVKQFLVESGHTTLP